MYAHNRFWYLVVALVNDILASARCSPWTPPKPTDGRLKPGGTGISTYTYQQFEKGESKPGTPISLHLHALDMDMTLDLAVEELVEGM